VAFSEHLLRTANFQAIVFLERVLKTLISPKSTLNSFKSASAAPISRRIAAGLAALAFAGLAPLVQAPAQSLQVPNPAVSTAQSFQGSVPTGEATAQPIDLSLDDAIQRGLRPIWIQSI